MKKVRIWATVEVDCFIYPTEGDFGDTEYVIESAVPVKQELMDTPDSDYKLQLYEAVDDQLESEKASHELERALSAPGIDWLTGRRTA